MMTNDDNLESSLLTSSLLKIRSLYKFCYKLHMLSRTSVWKLFLHPSEEVTGDLPLQLLESITFYTEV